MRGSLGKDGPGGCLDTSRSKIFVSILFVEEFTAASPVLKDGSEWAFIIVTSVGASLAFDLVEAGLRKSSLPNPATTCS